ncbi:hypothetical protein [uncultured Paenibacillus sp.]|uniref:hypothetical protein n=1 Tax=uncultured Paenibacillus sp. TaxID=227322 RepID=UPI0028D8131B|nr:hypothetical protein [uncultured Paenibacillus sp.]
MDSSYHFIGSLFAHERPTAKHLVDMLLQRINDPGSTPAAMIKKPELVVRESTKKAP